MTLRRILALLALVPLVFTVCIAEEGAGEPERNLPEEPPPPEKEKECPCDDEPKNRCVYAKISLGATSGEHEKFNVNSLGDCPHWRYKTCGATIMEFAGLGKEIRDRMVAWYCESHPESEICDGGHGDFWDSIGDLDAHHECVGWESYVFSVIPIGGWVGALFRESCEDCCRCKVGYK